MNPFNNPHKRYLRPMGAERGNAPALANTEKRRTPKGRFFI